MPAARVIIVAYNSGEHLQRVLDGLAAQTFTDFETVLWDNASSDGAASSARLPANARLVTSPDNLGFAGGNNAAAKDADAEFLVLLNPDAFPEPDWLERLVAAARRRADAAMIGSLQLDDARPDHLDGAGDVYHAAGVPYRGGFGRPKPDAVPEGEVFGPCAAAALYRREAFEAVGGFDESFFCYCEDVDLAFRLRLAGWRGWLEPRAVVRHVGSASTGRRSDFSVYHGARNRVWTMVKNVPGPLLPVVLPLHVAATAALALDGVVRGREGTRALFRGVRDGVAGLGEVWPARRAVQRARRASSAQIARAMTWSPLKLARRAPDIRAPRVEEP